MLEICFNMKIEYTKSKMQDKIGIPSDLIDLDLKINYYIGVLYFNTKNESFLDINWVLEEDINIILFMKLWWYQIVNIVISDIKH